MGVKYENYYDVLGVKRDADAKEIKKAYHKLAREFHPDVNEDKAAAEEKFKKINEAYEVLKDPEKRQMYDQLGSNWQAGQDFKAPPGWNFHGDFGHDGRSYHSTGDAGDFSDFFEILFGGGGRRGSPFETYDFGPQERHGFSRKGADREADLELTLEEAYHGGSKKVRLSFQEMDPMGRIVTSSKEYDVNIPKGVTTGSRIRLKGMGDAGSGKGSAGDLFLNVRLKDTSSMKHKGHDLYLDYKVTPWEAMLGGKVEVPTMGGAIQMTLPKGAQTDHKYRLKEKGLPTKTGFGDLYVVIKIVVPEHLTEEEEKLVRELAKNSNFNPRGKRVV